MTCIGLDFGTSNSSAAIRLGDQARVLPIDGAAERPELFRSVLFFSDEGQVHAGARAISEYLAEGQGRFIQSIKSFLPSRTFSATQIAGRTYRLEELVALLMRRMREAAEGALGQPVTSVVLGRPARFSLDPDCDALAEKRLLEAARLAGFAEVQLCIEPIAAAFAYEATLTREELVLVGDFGAGTSDFTLMLLSPQRRRTPGPRTGDILGTSGVPIGGDRFDSAIMEHGLLRHFGGGSTYVVGANRMPMPPSILSRLLRWHEMSFIKERSVQQLLDRILDGTDNPRAITALSDLVNENLGFALFRQIERTKITLSSETRTRLALHEAAITVEETVTRAGFERWTSSLQGELTTCVEGLLADVGVAPEKIDRVVLTGGTSHVPSIREAFARRFGAGRLESEQGGGAFLSVALGLGLQAGAGTP
jgi:hypothetical chaperone protein